MKKATKKLLALAMVLVFLLQTTAAGAAQASNQASNASQTSSASLASQAAAPALASAYSDVKANDGNFLFINFLSKRGLLKGFPDGTFHPAAGLTRAEAAAALVKAAGLKISPAKAVFKDVGAKYWAAAAIAAGKDARLLSGYPDGTFRPEAKLTRAEGLTLILKLSKQADPGVDLPVLADIAPKHWAARPIAIGLASEMVGLASDNKHFLPDTPLTRGSLARALAVLLTKDPALYETTLTDKLNVVAGPVTVTRAGSQTPETINDSTGLQPGDTVKTGASGLADITFPDGTGLRLESDSQFVLKEARGRSYIKADGTPGIAIEWLAVDLKSGKMFGALATSSEASGDNSAKSSNNDSIGKSAALQARAMGLGNLSENRVRTAAAAAKPLAWWQQSGVKRTKVKVDMPTGIAAIRGTFWENKVNSDGSFTTSLLTGSAEITAGGRTIDLAGGQRTAVASTGIPPIPPVPLTTEDKKEWVAQKGWAQERAVEIQTKQEQKLPPPPPAEKPEQPAAPQLPQPLQPPQNPTPAQPQPAPTSSITSIIDSALTSAVQSTTTTVTTTPVDSGSSGGSSTTTAPTVVSYPPDGATNVSTMLSVMVAFDRNIHINNASQITYKKNTDNSNVFFTGQTKGALLFFIGSEVLLSPGTTYTVTIPSGALIDDAGKPVNGYTFSFTTRYATTVSGKVYAPDGSALNPADSVGMVNLYPKLGGSPIYTGLNSDGTFLVNGVPTGDYVLKVASNSSRYTNSNAVTIHLAANTPLYQNVNLSKPMVTGRVYNPPGSDPAAPVNATAYISPVDLNCEEAIPIGPDGTFMFGGLPTGDYKIRVESPASNGPNITDSLPVIMHLVQGSPVTQNIWLTNPTVTVPRTVYDASGNPTSLLITSLRVYPINTDYPMKNVSPQADGSYRIGGLPSGDYKIQASFYNTGFSNLYTTDIPVHVTAGTSQVVPINAGISVNGTVYTPTGAPYSSLYSSPSGMVSGYIGMHLDNGSGNSVNGFVDYLGNFSLNVPTAGTYKLYADVQDSVYTDPLPVTISVYQGMPSVPISLTTPEITGKVLNPDGSPMLVNDYMGVSVSSGSDFVKHVMVSPDGKFKVGGLPSGTYKIGTSGSNGKYTDSSPLYVSVVAGSVQEKNLQLTSPMISGKITIPDIQFIPQTASIYVELYDSSDNFVVAANVGNDGTFRFGPVSSGTYKLLPVVWGRNPFAGGNFTYVQVSGSAVDVSLNLSPAQITGKVLTTSGNSLSSQASKLGNVIIKNTSGQVIGKSWIGEAGVFKFGNLAPGSYKLQASMDPVNSSYLSSVEYSVTVTNGGAIVIQDITVANKV